MSREMFSQVSIEKHIGTDIKYRPNMEALKDVEAYFIDKCKEIGIEVAHDCVAEETTYFKTLSYTSFANMFIIHPLSFKVHGMQVAEAMHDSLAPVGHIDLLKQRIDKMEQGKYVMPDGSDMPKDNDIGDFTDIAILIGSNKFKDNISYVKLDMLISTLGSNLVLKPHPLSSKSLMQYLNKIKGDAQLADKHSDLYSLVAKAKKVHTLHTSESALMSLLMGKKITPIDKFGVTGCFTPFNEICFLADNPVEILDSVFASYKSGVVHPEVDKDWKGKIDKYVDYIMRKRNTQRGFYYES